MSSKVTFQNLKKSEKHFECKIQVPIVIHYGENPRRCISLPFLFRLFLNFLYHFMMMEWYVHRKMCHVMKKA